MLFYMLLKVETTVIQFVDYDIDKKNHSRLYQTSNIFDGVMV